MSSVLNRFIEMESLSWHTATYTCTGSQWIDGDFPQNMNRLPAHRHIRKLYLAARSFPEQAGADTLVRRHLRCLDHTVSHNHLEENVVRQFLKGWRATVGTTVYVSARITLSCIEQGFDSYMDTAALIKLLRKPSRIDLIYSYHMSQ